MKEYLKGNNSTYKPYIDSLPMDMGTFPHYYKNEYKQYLKGSLLENEINDHIRLFSKEYHYLKEKNLAEDFNLENYMKFRLILGARLFEISSLSNRVNYKIFEQNFFLLIYFKKKFIFKNNNNL